MERPALRRLLADIEAGKIDCVVTYKVDRFSRSLLDFAKMMETFDKYRVSSVSVTQQFNTATSMGRLMMNVLLSFAQFEREIIGERTRDKIAATRRKGKWAGGMPLLGYDLDPRCRRLVINEDEAARVRAIFALYLEHESLLPVVQELERRGWTTKRWTTRKGHERGGRPFTKTSLYKLLTNVVYVGKVRYKRKCTTASRPPSSTPHRVQSACRRCCSATARAATQRPATSSGRCSRACCGLCPCGCAGARAYDAEEGKCKSAPLLRVLLGAQKQGLRDCCPSKVDPRRARSNASWSIRSAAIGQAIPRWRHDVSSAGHESQDEARTAELEVEERGLAKDLTAWHREVGRLSSQVPTRRRRRTMGGSPGLSRLRRTLHDGIGPVEGRVGETWSVSRAEIARRWAEPRGGSTRPQRRSTLRPSTRCGESLTPHGTQARVVGLLGQSSVEYDGAR